MIGRLGSLIGLLACLAACGDRRWEPWISPSEPEYAPALALLKHDDPAFVFNAGPHLKATLIEGVHKRCILWVPDNYGDVIYEGRDRAYCFDAKTGRFLERL